MEILKKLCQSQMELLNKKAMLEKDSEKQQPDLDTVIADKIQQLDSRIEDSEKQIKEVGQKIQNDGEARAVFYEKTLDVLLQSALSNTHGTPTPRQQDLVRLLFDMLVSSYKRLQLNAIEELEADAREKQLKQRVEETQAAQSSAKRAYEINLTKLATDYEQKLEGIFKNINDTTISMLRCDDPHNRSGSSLLSSPSDVSPSDSERDTATVSNASTHRNSISTGVESVQLSLVVEECHLLRSQLARSAVNSDELASRCSELEFANHRLYREQEERDFQIKFLEEDRALFKDMVDDLKASLMAMGKEGKNIIDTVKDRASQKRRICVKGKDANTDSANPSHFGMNYTSLIEDAEDGNDDDDDSGWDPESTTIILDEFNLISDEIRYGEWPQPSPSNHSSLSASSITPPKINALTQVSVPSHVSVPVYDRLANPSYYTGHMRNVFDDKNIEQKRKKVQKIKSQERKVVSASSDWSGSNTNTNTNSGSGVGAGRRTDLLLSSSIGDSKDEPFERISIQTSSLKAAGQRSSLAGLSAQRPKRNLNRTNSAEWVMSTDETMNAPPPPNGPSSARHVRTNSFSSMTGSVSSSRPDSTRRKSVGALLPPPPPPQSHRDRKDSSTEESSGVVLQEDKLPNHMQAQEQVQPHDSIIIREI